MSDARPPSVRLARPADADVVGALLHDFNTEFGEPTPGAAALARRMRLLLDDDTDVLLGADGDTPRAHGSGPRASAGGPHAPDGVWHGLAVMRFRAAIWSEALECYLAELYVAPAQRGNGLGRGADYMDLGTGEQDVAARSLYESLGFSNREGKADGPVNYYYERQL